MQTAKKVVIVGGGASGLLCAIELLSGADALCCKDVLICERNERIGKKLAVTGNGQGNFTNNDLSLKHFYGDKEFIKAFFDDNKIALTDYFYNLGIPLVCEENGKYFPCSYQASSTLDVLRYILDYRNCEIKYSTQIVDIKNDGNVFLLKSIDGDTIIAENVVIATGGCASKHFGTDGNFYHILESFGHKITKLHPSLVQIKTNTSAIKGFKGIKTQARLSLFCDNKFVDDAVGDLLFTDYGVSGNTVFTLSSKLNFDKKMYLLIDFLPNMSLLNIAKMIDYRRTMHFFDEENVLTGIINKKIGQSIMRRNLNTDSKKIAEIVKNFKIDITGTLGFDYAQVTKGGVVTDDVNPISMQSKIVKNLFLTGEILNVDGDCGGYNLTFAFLSGIKAAKYIKNH